MSRPIAGSFAGSFAVAATLAAGFAGSLHDSATAQELPKSGTNGVELLYATDPAGTTSQLFQVDAELGSATALGAPFSGVPSRWAHRRRTLSALETEITVAEPLIFLTPTGDAVGNGGLHFVDARSGTLLADALIATGGNPPAYDAAVCEPLQMAFTAEDDGAGGTTLRGWSYATPGSLLPLSPASLTLPGTPAAHVSRIGVDLASNTLHVPTASGLQLVALSSGAPQMTLGPFVASGSYVPTTNPTRFDGPNGRIWLLGTSSFRASGAPRAAAWLAWSADGASSWSAEFGPIAGRLPGRKWVAAVGCTELAVVSDGNDAYAYYLLRDPDPSSGFVRAGAVGTVRFVGAAAPVGSTLLCPDRMGEPFAIPTVNGTRVAIESSVGPPWWTTPPGGAEKLTVLYTPLDALGSGTSEGVLGIAGPLNGRIQARGMDRPLWSADGKGLWATTSHFAGVTNPGTPGLEYLAVPAAAVLVDADRPVTVVDNPTSPNESITLGSVFDPNDPIAGAALAPFAFAGTVFHDGMSAGMAWQKKRKVQLLGQKQLQTPKFAQSPGLPSFPALLPPTFDDATGSTVAVPPSFGARRVAFDLHTAYGFLGLTQVTALQDVVWVQPTGIDFFAELGLLLPEAPIAIPLPLGWITTSEIRAL